MNIKMFYFTCMLFSSLITTGCANNNAINKVYAPNEQLDEVLNRYITIKATKPLCTIGKKHLKECNAFYVNQQNKAVNDLAINFNCHDSNKPVVDCFRLASELRALYLEYPNNKRIMMASALVEFEIGNINTSQQLLDLILLKRGAYPEAAILRSRIAMEEGNLTLARKIVKRQLSFTPFNPYLYELQAAYYYMEGHYSDALQAITASERFVGTNWRISYHRGIIYEAQEQWYKACKEYKGVLKENPNNKMLNAKVLLLREHIGCYVNQNENLALFNSF